MLVPPAYRGLDSCTKLVTVKACLVFLTYFLNATLAIGRNELLTCYGIPMVVGSCSLLLSECRVKIIQFLIPGVGDNLDALVLRDVALEAFQMVQ